MIKLTRAQRVALKRVYDRGPIWARTTGATTCDSAYGVGKPLTYRELRQRVQPTFTNDDCVMVHWCGMWLGIETDGYTHS